MLTFFYFYEKKFLFVDFIQKSYYICVLLILNKKKDG